MEPPRFARDIPIGQRAVPVGNLIRLASEAESRNVSILACSFIWSALVLWFRSRASLAAEILVLRHQINILRRYSPKRQTFSAMDRLIFAGLYGSRVFPIRDGSLGFPNRTSLSQE
jgi:hypothetical protein